MEERARRGLVPAALAGMAVLLLLLFFLPAYVNANRWRGRILSSLSAALGRPVSMDGVHLRLLPLPSFTLDNFSVSDNSAVPAEPILHAATVTARLRLLPLWRGRLEVSRITLDEASLNLRRKPDGEWNFDSLLQRTPALPASPTRGGAHAGQFPYIEVTGGRINIQRGMEKLPLCLTDADLAFWLGSPNEWRLRLRASPTRTDLPNSGLGTIRLDGNVERVTGSGPRGWRDAGIHLAGSWRQLPLGQFSRVLTRSDAGWRGEASATLNLTGTLHEEVAVLGLRLDGVRRENFVPAEPLEISATCRTQLKPFQHSITAANCLLPTGGGAIMADGSADWGEGSSRGAHVKLTAVSVAAERVLDAVRCVRQGIAPDLSAEGYWSAKLLWDSDVPSGTPRLRGTADLKDGVLRAGLLSTPAELPPIHFVAGPEPAAVPAEPSAGAKAPVQGRQRRKPRSPAGKPAASVLTMQMPVQSSAFALPLGGAGPLNVQLGAARNGYALRVQGDADAGRLTSLLKVLGMVQLRTVRSMTGGASANLLLTGPWQVDSSGPTPQGTLALQDVRLNTAWLPSPVTLTRGNIAWTAAGARLSGMEAEWAGSTWDVTADNGSDCEGGVCTWSVQVHTPRLNASAIESAFHEEPAQRFLNWIGGGQQAGWPKALVALDAGQAVIGNLPVQQLSAGVTVAGSTLKVTRLSASLLGGTLEGTGNWDVGTGDARLILAGSSLSVASAGSIFGERWGKGTGEFQAQLDFAGSLDPRGSYSLMLRGGALLGAGLEGTPLARFDAWQISGTVGGSAVHLERSALLTAAGATTQEATGEIGYNRDVRLTLRTAGQPGPVQSSVSGHLGLPESAAGTQAAKAAATQGAAQPEARRKGDAK